MQGCKTIHPSFVHYGQGFCLLDMNSSYHGKSLDMIKVQEWGFLGKHKKMEAFCVFI